MYIIIIIDVLYPKVTRFFMHSRIKKKITALLLALAMLFSVASLLISCYDNGDGGDFDNSSSENGKNDEGDNDNTSPESGNGDSDAPNEEESYHDKIVVPEYKDYNKSTVNFKEMVYERPAFATVLSSFDTTISMIKENSETYEEQLSAVVALEDGYTDILTMRSFAEIYNSIDSSNSFWNAEHIYISENYPSFAKKVEDLYVCAANSPHAERFEDEYFGAGLIEKYKDGGIFSDNMVKLWADEELLEAEYSALSTATVEITFNKETDTVDSLLKKYKERYGENSREYLAAETSCLQLYEYKLEELSTEIFVSLIQVRKLIADELGHSSYVTYAYESFDRSYTPAEMSAFLDDVSEYVVPVFSILYSFVFYYYFQDAKPADITLDTLINNGYSTLSEVDSGLADIFRFMLQFELYNIEKSDVNRQIGAFTTYLFGYEAPFIFMSADGSISDYSTLYHEFGHFADYFINNGKSADLDRSEVSSQGLEYIMLHYMKDKLSQDDSQYLTYKGLCSALEALIYQGFYARVEELIYALPYDSINVSNLNAAVVSAAEQFGLNSEYVNSISFVFIPHTFLYPFYVQSYCTSVIPALELYFMESETALSVYKSFIDRGDSNMTFEEALTGAGLSSPFSEGTLRDIADAIYYEVTGVHYYNKDNKSAAPL